MINASVMNTNIAATTARTTTTTPVSLLKKKPRITININTSITKGKKTTKEYDIESQSKFYQTDLFKNNAYFERPMPRFTSIYFIRC